MLFKIICFLSFYVPVVSLVGIINFSLYKNNIFTPLYLYSFLYLVTVYPGGIVIFLEKNQYWGYLTLLIVGILLPCISAFVIGANKRLYKNFRPFFIKRVSKKKIDKTKILILAIISIITSLIVIIYTKKIFKNAPLFLIMSSSLSDITGSIIAKGREETIQGYGKLFSLFSLLYRLLLVLFSMYFLRIYYYKRSLFSFIMLFITTSVGVFASLVAASKALAIYFILQLIIFYYVSFKNSIVKKRELHYLCIFFFLFIVYIWLWYYIMFKNFNLVVNAFIKRFFYTFPQIIYEVYTTFGKDIPYLLGKTFPNFHILPFKNINFAMLMGDILQTKEGRLTAIRIGLHTVANTASIAEWYANFGIFGAVIWGIILGWIFHGFYLWYQTSSKGFLETAVYSIFSMKFSFLAIQYTGSLFDYKGLTLIFIYFLIKFKSKLVFKTKIDRDKVKFFVYG